MNERADEWDSTQVASQQPGQTEIDGMVMTVYIGFMLHFVAWIMQLLRGEGVNHNSCRGEEDTCTESRLPHHVKAA